MKYENIIQHYYETIRTSEYFNAFTPCRKIELLYPPFYQTIQELIKSYMEEHETEPDILETYRSNDLQLKYYLDGVSRIKINGTHHFGLAVDLVEFGENKIDYNKLDYEWLRKKAKELNLTVLNWELCHYQHIPVGEQMILRNEISLSSGNY